MTREYISTQILRDLLHKHLPPVSFHLGILNTADIVLPDPILDYNLFISL